MARLGWPTGHGEKLRKERRKFASGTARTLAETEKLTAAALAKASMAEAERKEIGATKRKGIEETGLKGRLEKEQEFAKPLQTAEIGRREALKELREAEAGGTRYETEFGRSMEDALQNIIRARSSEATTVAEEAALGLGEEKRTIRLRDAAARDAALRAAAPPAAVPKVPAKPGRTINPVLKKAWRLSPPGAALYGYKNISDWLVHGAKEGAEWAFPRTK